MGNERANVAGLMMFDPECIQPMYTDGAAWLLVNNSICYQVTADAGDGSLADDIDNTDFSGQAGTSGTVAQCPTGTAIFFYHKSQMYLYYGDKPASYGSGGTDSMDAADLKSVGLGAAIESVTNCVGHIVRKRYSRIRRFCRTERHCYIVRIWSFGPRRFSHALRSSNVVC